MNALIQWYWNNPFAQRATWALIHFLWQGCAIAGMLLVALYLLRRATPQIRWAASCVALGLMVIAPLVTACYIAPERPLRPPSCELMPPRR